MRITADFTQISSSTGALEAGEYICQVADIEEGETKENKLPQLVFMLEVKDPNHPTHDGHPLRQYVVLVTKKGQPNKMGLGQVKAYAEAILGEEAANNPEGIDVDELKNGTVLVVLSQRSYDEKGSDGEPTGRQKITNDVEKILPVS